MAQICAFDHKTGLGKLSEQCRHPRSEILSEEQREEEYEISKSNVFALI